MSVPFAPFRPVSVMFLEPPDSELFAFLQEAHRLVARVPEILTAIDADLDLHGLRKKALRLQDARWWQARQLGLPTLDFASGVGDPETLRLGIGRPRTPALAVYLFLCARGYFGGFKAATATDLMLESVTLRVFLSNQGMDLPGRSTLTELVNAVSLTTRTRIFDAQIAAILDEGWDDFSMFLQDSTAVEGNTLWPSESRLMVDLVARMWRRGGRLDTLGLPRLDAPRVAKILGPMADLDREISLAPLGTERARTRRHRYEALLRKARKASTLLGPAIQEVARALATLDVPPSQRARAARVVTWLRTDLTSLRKVIACCEARIVRGEKVAIGDKVLSVSDPDVGFIVKGERDPVVGYKPQLARSGRGFVTGLIVPQGNAADSGQLLPMYDAVVARTSVVPKVASMDDGYSSRAARAVLKARGVAVVSVSGAKGKHITPAAEWDSEEYAEARDDRSAVESLMFTIKQGFDFGRVARRGLSNVEAELLEKVLAYNFCRMASSRRAVQEAAADAALAA